MKKCINKAPRASKLLVDAALQLGLKAEIIQRSTSQHRRHNTMGSTFVPQKVVIINDIRMSVAMAKQYIAARIKQRDIKCITFNTII